MNAFYLLLFIMTHLMKPALAIVGGSPIPITTAPFMAALQINSKFTCGAVIVGPKTVLTSVECVSGYDPKRITLRVGTDLMNNGGLIREVNAVHVHPSYDDLWIDYDIAALKLKEPLRFSGSIAAATIRTKLPFYPGTAVTSIGWGSDKADGSFPKGLRAKTERTIHPVLCSDFHGKGTITDRMLCAGDLPHGVGSGNCRGDVGGPLVETETKELVGIVSFGSSCGKGLWPGVFSWLGNEEIMKFVEGRLLADGKGI